MNYKSIRKNKSYPGYEKSKRVREYSENQPASIIGFLLLLCGLLTFLTNHLEIRRTQLLLNKSKHAHKSPTQRKHQRKQRREEQLIKRQKFQKLQQEKQNKEGLIQEGLIQEGLMKNEQHPCLMARPAPIPDIWVLVPGGNGAEFLPTAIESIHRQDVHVRAFYIDDHSTDGSAEIIKASLRQGDELVVTDEHCGPACTKFIALDEISKLANANDVVVILDADDYFISSQASKRILEEYTSGETWITYGSFEGRWSNQVRAVTQKEFETIRSSPWVYGHPRSFRVGLTKYLYKLDFQTSGKYFMKASERGFMYRWLELTGFSRTKLIKDKLVHYRWRLDNTVNTINPKKRVQLFNFIKNMHPSSVLDSIHVILGVSDLEMLVVRLNQLIEQTVVGRIELHVLVKDEAGKEAVNKFVEKFKRDINEFHSERAKYNLGFRNLTVHETVDSTNTHFGNERFRIAQKLQKTSLVDYIIFLDENLEMEDAKEVSKVYDFNYDKGYIEQLWNSRKPRSHLGWNGKKEWGRSYFNRSYFDSVLEMENVTNTLTKNMMNTTKNEEWLFTSYGGSVIDAGIFQDKDLLKCPKEYEKFDDFWVTYLMQSHGWHMGRIDVKPKMTKTTRNLMGSSEEEKRINEDIIYDGMMEDNLKFIREVDGNISFLKYLQDRGFACKVRNEKNVSDLPFWRQKW